MHAPDKLKSEVARRRTFAIISHPDAGKTTLTEKLLLYGGAIRQAGMVKAKIGKKQTTSDWMEIEKQRGISISSTVLQFDYLDYRINLLDTPGHRDFSEDTYRTLTAADAAVMLIDAAKGVEAQTRKLFEVCRLSGIPIFTFINKMDRSGRDPLDLIDEIEKVLGIRSCPMNWPIGMGEDFIGVYDVQKQAIHYYEPHTDVHTKSRITDVKVKDLTAIATTPEFQTPRRQAALEQFLYELDLLQIAGDAFDHDKVMKGQLTPTFFGSAMNNFGVEYFLNTFVRIAPPPRARTPQTKGLEPENSKFSSLIFKIQANMDPKHRDCLVFMRVCSGEFTPGIRVQIPRSQKEVRLLHGLNIFGQDRVIVDEAVAGDIIGVVDSGGYFRIGDTLTEVEGIQYKTIPRFAPEHFAAVTGLDPTKRKQLLKGIQQLADEGVIQVLRRPGSGDTGFILGAVGVLQFEVFEQRLRSEYGVAVRLDKQSYTSSRWVLSPPDEAKNLSGSEILLLEDRDGHLIILFMNDWARRILLTDHPHIQLSETF